MKNIVTLTLSKVFLVFLLIAAVSCNTSTHTSHESADSFEWEAERFADVRVLRYQVPGFNELSLKQKELVYYLVQAGLSGRDIIYDTNYRHNLEIRKALDQIAGNYSGDRDTDNWAAFMTYCKRIWMANGIHHHYSMDKIEPGFDADYMKELLSDAGLTLSSDAMEAIFDPSKDAKKVNLDESKGLLLGSATNFYDPDVTEKEAQAFYNSKKVPGDDEPVWHGLNSKLEKNDDGTLSEAVYYEDGMYGSAIKQVIYWLEKAADVAENEPQKKALELLIEYYRTGSLETWDEFNIAWLSATDGDVDYINGFVEVYNDPIGYKGSYENIVQINDFEASARMKVLSDNAQWFEDNSTIMDEHKKENVVGVSYKVVSVAGESGDASPSTPIGVNLPNSNWIRAKHGSKSVSLGNIINAYDRASGGGLLREFAHDEEEIERGLEYGELASKLSTALHEVIGHASGKLEPGVGTPSETLKNYRSTLEEARADIVGLYFIMDPKIVELGLMPSLEVAKADYDSFISNGLLKQLRRIELGRDVEESHMRNRQLIAKWVFEKGKPDNVIAEVRRDGKVYYDITDYDKLKGLFGELLKEIQRIKSQGDYEAAKALIEGYGVKVDQDIHQEVLDRVAPLNSPPYSGFINPVYELVTDDEGNLEDILVSYPDDFVQQMLDYGKNYSFL